jgi:DHA2 family multidrug resistance protein-like MFS transporter
MVSVDTTVLYTALPTLTSDLQADAAQKLWIINAYPLVMAGLLPGAGTLGDRIGHKRMFLAGLALFAAASLLAAFAPSPPVLIAARAFLAVGAAAMLPATAALIRITFDDERERGIAIGVWGTMAVLGAALGPIVGGLLLQRFWWGSVFLLNIPVVLLARAATAAVVPGGPGHRDRPWDLIASLQAMIALVGLVYAIQEAAKPGPIPLAIVLALLAAAAGGSMFLRRQRRQTYPLIDFSLFGNRSCSRGDRGRTGDGRHRGIDLLLTRRSAVWPDPLHAGLIVTAFAASLPVGWWLRLVPRTAPADRRRPAPGRLGILVTLPTPGAIPCWAAAGARHGSCRACPGLRGPGSVMVAASAAIIGGARRGARAWPPRSSRSPTS